MQSVVAQVPSYPALPPKPEQQCLPELIPRNTSAVVEDNQWNVDRSTAPHVQFVVAQFSICCTEASVEEGEAIDHRGQDSELHTGQTNRGKQVSRLREDG